MLEFFGKLLRAFYSPLLSLAVSHPFISATILILLSFAPAIPFIIVWYIAFGILQALVLVILFCIGFGRRGVRRGSSAASFQARKYGAFTPRGGCFSSSQSFAGRPSRMTSVFGPVNPFWKMVGWIFRIVAVIILFSYFFRSVPQTVSRSVSMMSHFVTDVLRTFRRFLGTHSVSMISHFVTDILRTFRRFLGTHSVSVMSHFVKDVLHTFRRFLGTCSVSMMSHFMTDVLGTFRRFLGTHSVSIMSRFVTDVLHTFRRFLGRCSISMVSHFMMGVLRTFRRFLWTHSVSIVSHFVVNVLLDE
ncbi:hypothetical protein BDQ17DRAFT_1547903, partial [Cyathus striatus]